MQYSEVRPSFVDVSWACCNDRRVRWNSSARLARARSSAVPPPRTTDWSNRGADPGVGVSRQQVVPMLRDDGRPGEVRLDHLNEPGLVRGDAVPVEEPLEIGNQEIVLRGQLHDAGVDGVQAPA